MHEWLRLICFAPITLGSIISIMDSLVRMSSVRHRSGAVLMSKHSKCVFVPDFG